MSADVLDDIANTLLEMNIEVSEQHVVPSTIIRMRAHTVWAHHASHAYVDALAYRLGIHGLGSGTISNNVPVYSILTPPDIVVILCGRGHGRSLIGGSSQRGL